MDLNKEALIWLKTKLSSKKLALKHTNSNTLKDIPNTELTIVRLNREIDIINLLISKL